MSETKLNLKAVFLAAAAILFLLFAGGRTVQADTTTFTYGETVCTIDDDGNLVISQGTDSNGDGIYEMYDWGSGYASRFVRYYADVITSVSIEDGQIIYFPEGNYMFYNCTALETADLSGFVFEEGASGAYMFYGCTALTSVTADDTLDVSELTSAYRMFYNCSSLEEADLNGFDFDKVTTTAYMFYNCSSLLECDMSKFDGSLVTTTYAMFNGCKVIESIDLSSFTGESLTNCALMFQENCYLSNLSLGSVDAQNLTNMYAMFYLCYRLTYIDLSGFGTDSDEFDTTSSSGGMNISLTGAGFYADSFSIKISDNFFKGSSDIMVGWWLSEDGTYYSTAALENGYAGAGTYTYTNVEPENYVGTNGTYTKSYTSVYRLYGITNANAISDDDNELFYAFCLNQSVTYLDEYGYYILTEVTNNDELQEILESSGANDIENLDEDDSDYIQILANAEDEDACELSSLGDDEFEQLSVVLYYGLKLATEGGDYSYRDLQFDIWAVRLGLSVSAELGEYLESLGLISDDMSAYEAAEAAGLSFTILVYVSQQGMQTITSIKAAYAISVSKQDLDGEELPGASMAVYAKEDDGTYGSTALYSWTSGESVYVISGIEAGDYKLVEAAAPSGYEVSTEIEFTVDDDGNVTYTYEYKDASGNKIVISGDKKYTYVYDEDESDWVLSKTEDFDADGTIVMYDATEEFTITISKKEIAGSDELPGAELTLTNESETVIDSWTSGTEAHEITLKAGTYTLTETTAPDGYAVAESITFTINEDGTVDSTSESSVTMYDAPYVYISKTTLSGSKELSGAELSILDENGDTVYSWTSGSSAKEFTLSAGTYTLVEITAPDGYAVSESITFTVDESGHVENTDDDTVTMKDYPVITISKKAVSGSDELPGAKLVVADEDGKTVYSWTSGTEAKEITLDPGTYTLTETLAPDGYTVAESITFTVDDDGNVSGSDDNTVTMYDVLEEFTITISKKEVSGTDELSGALLLINEGEDGSTDTDTALCSWTSGSTAKEVYLTMGTYTLVEVTAPDGYEVAESITFTVNSDGSVDSTGDCTVTMYDEKTPTYTIYIKKTDVSGNEIEGASLYLTDEQGKVIESWTSDGSVHEIEVEEGTYVLVEELPPTEGGYVKATDITFAVSFKDGEVLIDGVSTDTVTMVDEINELKISKQDEAGSEIGGAKLQITDSDGDVIYAWTTIEDTTHIITGIDPGAYMLSEVSTPDGYETADDITFTVNSDGTITAQGETSASLTIVMTDEDEEEEEEEEEPFDVYFAKVDEDGTRIAGAVLKLTDIEGNKIASWTSTVYLKKLTLDPGNYVLSETTTPSGYVTASQIEFTVNEDGTVTISSGDGTVTTESPIVITMIDETDESSKTVKFKKLDEDGEYLEGAVLTVYDEDGDAVTYWTTDDTYREISLPAGIYTLSETTVPSGYAQADDIEFTVDEDGTVYVDDEEVDYIVMVDEVTEITIYKVDSETGEGLSWAYLELLDEDGDVILAWRSDGSGKTVTGLEIGETYTLHEVYAPYGYEVADDIEFTVNDDGTLTTDDDDDATSITMEDVPSEEETPETGVLQVTKTVTGDDGADYTKEFGFIITFLNPDGSYYTESLSYIKSDGESGTVAPDSLGQIGFTLSHGEAITFYNVLADTVYTITELDYTSEGYTGSAESYVYSQDSGLVSAAFTNTYSGDAASYSSGSSVTSGLSGASAGETSITGEITSSTDRDTGDSSNMVLWVLAMAGGVLLLTAGILIFCRKKRTE